MKLFKLSLVLATALLVLGCNNSSNGTTSYNPPAQPVQPVQPVQPPEPVEPVDPGQSIPTAGVGSIKADMDCSGGTITTNYSFGNVDENDKNFIIQYQRNGALEDLTYPSTSTTGSRMLVKDIYYARANDSENPAFWVVTISFQTPDETYNLVTATLRQPACTEDDDNLTAVNTIYEVK